MDARGGDPPFRSNGVACAIPARGLRLATAHRAQGAPAIAALFQHEDVPTCTGLAGGADACSTARTSAAFVHIRPQRVYRKETGKASSR